MPTRAQMHRHQAAELFGRLVEPASYEERIAGGETVRALWWCQPFAQLMLNGKVETRSRSTNVRGLVLICSTKRAYKHQQIMNITGDTIMSIIQHDLLKYHHKGMQHLLNGYAIGIGELYASDTMKSDEEHLTYVKYRPGLWCWRFRAVRPIEPFPLPGKQGWSIIDNETRYKIKFI